MQPEALPRGGQRSVPREWGHWGLSLIAYFHSSSGPKSRGSLGHTQKWQMHPMSRDCLVVLVILSLVTRESLGREHRMKQNTVPDAHGRVGAQGWEEECESITRT